MSAKSESASFDTIVAEALAKMRDTAAASASYEVDRSSGQWTVRRARKGSDESFASEVMARLPGSADR